MLRFLFFIVLVRVFVAGDLELSPDEAYYWNWSRHPDWSYYDHPPMIAWLIGVSTFFGGPSELWVRMPVIVLSLGLSAVVYQWAASFCPTSQAVRSKAVVWLNVILIFSVGGVVATPDTPLVFFVTLTLYGLCKALFENKPFFWCFSGFSFGLALLSKYTAFLLLPCLMLFLFFSNSFRSQLWKKDLYLFSIIALVVFSPVLFWNAANNWVSFKFQLGHAFTIKEVQPVASFLEFIGGQLLITTPIVFAGLAASIGFCYHLWVREGDDRLLFLFCFSAPILLFFTLISLKSKVEGNWPVIAYVPAILAMAVFETERKREVARIPALRFISKWGLASAIIIVAVLHLQVVWRVVPWSDLSLKRAYGWKLLGDHVGQAFHDSSLKLDFIFARRHAIAGEIAFYLPGQPETRIVHGAERYSFLKKHEQLVGKNGLYVVQKGREGLEEIVRYFESVAELPQLTVTADGKVFRTFRMYRCLEYKGGLIET